MPDVVTTVETIKPQGFFGALMASIKRVGLGFGMLCIAPLMIFWNECNSVEVAEALDEGAGAVVSVEPATVNPNNEGALVHMSGDATTSNTLSDGMFGVSGTYIRLSRSVEMYQWKEHKEEKTTNDQKTTTYTYEKVWDDSAHKSSGFEEPVGHTNPSSWNYDDDSWQAINVTVGAFSLNESLIDGIDGSQDIAPPENSARGGTVLGNYLYTGSPGGPAVGDYRIRWSAVSPGPVSLVAGQSGSSFEPFLTSNGRDISMIDNGTHTAQEMFDAAKQRNVLITWGIRIIGFLLLFGGILNIVGPLKVVADKVPLIGGVFSAGLTAISFLGASFLWSVVVGLAWLTARPLLGIFLLMMSAGAFVGAIVLIFLGIRKAKAATAAG